MPSLSDEVKNSFLPQGELGRLRHEASRTLNREETRLYHKADKGIRRAAPLRKAVF